MKVRKTTFLKKQLMLLLFLISAGAFAQTPTFSAYAPSVVTHRTPITITGSNFTGVTAVRFNTINATSFSVNSNGTAITAVLPEVTGITAGTSSPVSVSVIKSSTTTTFSTTLSYVAPAATPTNAGVTRIITNFNGYFVTSAATGNTSLQPDTSHSLLAFTYDGTQYSTAPNSEMGTTLTSGTRGTTTGAYTQGNFRALPINNIAGTAGPSNSGDPNLIVLAKNIDGSSTTSVPTAQSVQGLTVRDVLIDGIRGLDLGTGVTNLPSSSVLSFQASNILTNVAEDAIPDILVSQVASPSNNSFDVFCFVDVNGNIVGKPVQINIFGVNAVGTYKTDFFSLPAAAALNTARVNGVATPGGETRDIRLVAYRLIDFGITEANRTQAVQFKVMPSGTSDPAFMAYNRSSFDVPAPEINTQPASVAACSGTATFSVTLNLGQGTEVPTYQWEKDGMPITEGTSGITGTATATLSVPVNGANAGIYTVLVTNPSGAVRSTPAYLNTILLASTGSVTCYDPAVTTYVETGAVGNTPTYQWYSTTRTAGTTPTALNTGTDTAIQGATSARYTPSAFNQNQSYYYFAKVFPAGNDCVIAAKYTPVLEFKVNRAAPGTATSDYLSFCAGGTATITLANSVGTRQWQQSTDGGATWTNVTTGTGGTTTVYRTAPLSVTTKFRALVASGACTGTTSNEITVTVNEVTVWTGATDILWNTATNWSCGTVPTIYNKVQIPAVTVQGRMPNVIGNQGYAKDITVDNGARLTVNTSGTLNVVNNIAVATGGFFTVENNASLVQQNSTIANTGNVKVTRNSNNLYKLDYTLWSSPVTGQNLQAFSPSTLSTRFYVYGTAPAPTQANPNAVHEYYLTVDPALTSFAAAKAYLIRMPNMISGNGTYNAGTSATVFQGDFTGVPNNGTITLPLNTQDARYTAIGNPYASPISVADFYAGNTTVLDNTTGIYFWRKKNDATVSSYAVLSNAAFVPNTAYAINGNHGGDPNYTSGGSTQRDFYPVSGGNAANPNWRISQGQGFIVKTKAGVANPQITFTNSMRREAPASGNQAFFRTGETVASRFWLNIVGNTEQEFSQMAVAYLADATLDLDYSYEASSRTNAANVTLYSLSQDTALTIQARPSFTTTDVVPVGFNAATAGSFNIALDHFDGVFTDGQNIYLKDNATNAVHDLRNGNYTFATEAGRFDERFEVVFTTDALGTETPQLNANNVIIFKEGSSININAGTAQMTDVTVYDVRGRVLFTKSGINATTTVVSGLQAAQEVLIIEVNTVKGKVSKKLVF
ncbi:hypothetical protein Q765_14980 [Flavobacterium rivuli WB 3.3-2 = DSM 21788]|uniref:Ig-like domain-containing protein n=1 Tax=Flavobacterium rivuli WB 3.3-2 = DSM 21788 TaxID=1121895 RepID=A0A0A2M2B0_9FLAO|nr:T9SS sorting signal type C domain-containing protein [Flavobacterium rivuli]KGO85721.1 hypothetical protein Q765_14980 [Flavobacterium rivuli WB 3.3-2 = DSM 21788]